MCSTIANSWTIPRSCNRETPLHTTRQSLNVVQAEDSHSYAGTEDNEQHCGACSRKCHQIQGYIASVGDKHHAMMIYARNISDND